MLRAERFAVFVALLSAGMPALGGCRPPETRDDPYRLLDESDAARRAPPRASRRAPAVRSAPVRAPEEPPHGGTTSAPDAAPRTVTLVWIPALLGRLETCGCTEHQDGGLARLAALIAAERRRDPRVLVLSGGNLFTGVTPYDEAKAETLAAALGLMGVDAVLATPDLFLYGRARVPALARRLGGALVAGNLTDETGRLPLLRSWQSADGAVEVFGLVDRTPQVLQEPASLGLFEQVPWRQRPFAPEHYGLRLEAPGEVLEVLRREGADAAAPGGSAPSARPLRVLLLQLDGAVAEQVLPDHHGFDLVLSGAFPGTERRFAARAEADDPRTALPDATYFPEFAPGAAVRRFACETASDGAVTIRDAVVTLDEAWPDEPRVRALLDSLYRRVAATPEFARGARSPLADLHAERDAANAFVGVDRCAECHADQTARHAQTPHARSFQPLRREGRELQPECLSCHTTGSGLPGGFDPVTRPAALAQVGCEVCHGPGARHAVGPTAANIRRELAGADCARCHTPEQRPGFLSDFAALRRAASHQ